VVLVHLCHKTLGPSPITAEDQEEEEGFGQTHAAKGVLKLQEDEDGWGMLPDKRHLSLEDRKQVIRLYVTI
jgi:hypothetical protein